jgi:hypothetical protein
VNALKGEEKMPIGPGKYDDLCTYVREQSQAKAALVIILDGKLGSGFSVQAHGGPLPGLPALLEDIAKQIRGDIST